jgi:hypothetical protein
MAERLAPSGQGMRIAVRQALHPLIEAAPRQAPGLASPVLATCPFGARDGNTHPDRHSLSGQRGCPRGWSRIPCTGDARGDGRRIPSVLQLPLPLRGKERGGRLRGPEPCPEGGSLAYAGRPRGLPLRGKHFPSRVRGRTSAWEDIPSSESLAILTVWPKRPSVSASLTRSELRLPPCLA